MRHYEVTVGDHLVFAGPDLSKARTVYDREVKAHVGARYDYVALYEYHEVLRRYEILDDNDMI